MPVDYEHAFNSGDAVEFRYLNDWWDATVTTWHGNKIYKIECAGLGDRFAYESELRAKDADSKTNR